MLFPCKNHLFYSAKNNQHLDRPKLELMFGVLDMGEAKMAEVSSEVTLFR